MEEIMKYGEEERNEAHPFLNIYGDLYRANAETPDRQTQGAASSGPARGIYGDLYDTAGAEETLREYAALSDRRLNADFLVMNYPALEEPINKLRSMGKEDAKIERYLLRLESEILFYKTPDKVNKAFGRTPEGMDIARRDSERYKRDAYRAAFGGTLSDEEVEERVAAAKTLGVRETLFLKYDGLYQDKKIRHALNLREGYLDTIANAAESERLNAELSLMNWDAVEKGRELTEAEEKRLDWIEKRIEELQPALTNSLFQNMVGGLVGYGAQQLGSASRSVPYMAGGALMGLGAAALNPPTFVLGPLAKGAEGVTAAITGAIGGWQAGRVYDMAKLEGGGAYREYMKITDKNGSHMDRQTARFAAFGVGILNAFIEEAQFQTVLRGMGFSGDKQALKAAVAKVTKIPSVAQAIADGVKVYAGNVTSEIGEEVAQKLVTIVGGEIGKIVSGPDFEGISLGELLSDLGEEAKGAFTQLALAVAPGGIRTAYSGVRAAAQAKVIDDVVSEAADIETREKAAREAKAKEKDGRTQFAPTGAEDEFVFLPKDAVESYMQGRKESVELKRGDSVNLTTGQVERANAPGAKLNIDMTRTAGDEIMMTAAEFEELEKNAPELAMAVKNDVRRGANGVTANEAAKKLDRKLKREVTPEERAARELQKDIQKRAQGAGYNPEQARTFARVAAAAAARLSKTAGRPIRDFANFEMIRTSYERWKAKQEGQENYNQPINPDVDMDAEVDIVDIDLGQTIDAQLSTTQDMLTHIKSFVGKPGMLSADSKAKLELSSNGNAKHFVRSSKKGLTYEEMDVRSAALNSIDDIVNNAVLIETYPNRDSDTPHLKNVHRLYVPLRIGNDTYTLRVVAHEMKEKAGLIPINADLFDLIIDKKDPASESQSGTTLTGASPAPTGSEAKITIRDMLRGVKDAEGNAYIYEQRVLQAISSADTSIRQVAAAFKKINWTLGTVNLDIGGGRFNEGTDYLSSRGVENLVFDPFNRDEKHNRTVIDRLREGKVDSATATNVLNVIREDAIRDVIIHQAARAIKPDGVVYFQIYEGDRKGVGKQTSKGWQNNAKTDSYSDAIRKYFGDVVIRGNIIEARNPNTVTPAIWSFNGNEVLFQRGYHGSPHRGIVRFLLDRIGTGEGAQAYGWGLYFAENREVGEEYRKKLSGMSNIPMPHTDDFYWINPDGEWDHYKFSLGDKGYSVNNIRDAASETEAHKRYKEAKRQYEDDKKGQLYGVELPESDVLLDWDKPFSEQPKKVKEALNGTISDPSLRRYLGVLNGDTKHNKGQQIYQALSNRYMEQNSASRTESDRAASEYLNSLGIPGHQYLDQGSRDNGGTHNFVVWSEDAVDVAETYYQGGLTEDASAGENSREVSDERASGTDSNGIKVTIRDMLRGVKDAQGNAYFQTAPTVGSEAFKKWFGESKVVDENGEPLVVYTGTDVSDIEIFDAKQSGRKSKTGAPEGSFFFTNWREIAESYTVRHVWMTGKQDYYENATVMPVYLRIKKPLKVNAKGENWQTISYKGEDWDINSLAEMAKNSGKYDGVIVTNVYDKGIGDVDYKKLKKPTTYVAFSPEQIKSVDNRGTWDAGNPNIYYQEVYEQSAYHASPVRDIEKMSLQKVGTGEGNSVYGWGINASESKTLADEGYRQLLWEDDGQLYRLEVPENSELLDWDSAISEQPDAVRKALANGAESNSIIAQAIKSDMTGRQLYEALSGGDDWRATVEGKKNASLLLDSLGIPGLRYFDGDTLDWGGTPGNGFVIWNEDTVNVVETFYQDGLTESASAGENSREVSAVERQERAERVREIKALSPLSVEVGAPLDKKGAEDIIDSFGPLENERDKRKASFPMSTVGKIIKHQGFDISTIVNDIPILFETSIPAWSEPEILRDGHKEHPNFKAYHHYVNKFSDGADTYFIRFSVIERKAKPGKTGDNFIHSTSISDVSIYKTNDDLSQSIRLKVPVLGKQSSFIDTRLQEFFDSVKPDSEISTEGRPERGGPAYRQGRNADPNAATILMEEFISVMGFFEGANASSPYHEVMHHFLNIYDDLYDVAGVEEWLKRDFETILSESGVTLEEFRNDSAKKRETHEKFARGFELYMATGEAPTKTLRGVFENLRRWLLEVYGDVQKIFGMELSDSMREVYDRLLATPEEMTEEYRRKTTIADKAAEAASIDEAIERDVAEERARRELEASLEASEKARAEIYEKWNLDDLDAIATESVDGYLAYLEDTEHQRNARAEKKAVLDNIQAAAGKIKYDTLVRETGSEAANELRKKMPGLFGKDGIGIDVAAESVGMDTNGLVKFLGEYGNEKVKNALPILEVNNDSFNALIDRVGIENTRKYLTNRKRYLSALQKERQAVYDSSKNGTEADEAAKKDLEDIYREKKEIEESAKALDRILSENKGGRPENKGGRTQFAPTEDTTVTLGDAMKRGYEMAERAARQGYREGVNAEREKRKRLKERIDALREKKRAIQWERGEINKRVRHINRMAGSENIKWGAKKEIEKKLAGYDLKRRRKSALRLRAELEEYLTGNPEAGETINSADLKYLGTTPLNDMSLTTLYTLHDEVKEIYERGKREYAEWEAARQERIDRKGAALRKALGKVKADLPILRMSASGTKKQYEGVRGKIEKAKDWAHAATLGGQRFFDWLDGGAAEYNGPFVRFFMDDFNAARDEELRHIFARREWMGEEIKKLGLDIRDFSKIRVRDVYGHDFTTDEIMELYMGMKNEKKSRAILFGVFGDERVGDEHTEMAKSAVVSRLIQTLTPAERAAAELVAKDHEMNAARIEARMIEAFNKGFEREENYTSIHRVEHGSPQGLIDADSADALEEGVAGAGFLSRVEDGFIKSRVNIGDEHQKGIRLGLFDNWHGDVSAHEHAAAFGSLARETAGALMAGDPIGRAVEQGKFSRIQEPPNFRDASPEERGAKQAEHKTVGRMIKERYGDLAWKTLVDYFNITVTDDARVARGVLDGAAGFFARNMSLTYLSYNLGTVMKQITSVPRFLMTAGPTNLFFSIAEFIASPRKFLNEVYALDPQMRDRAGSPILRALKDRMKGDDIKNQALREAHRRYMNTLEAGIRPIAIMDRIVAAIGWRATYDANLRNLGAEGAIREAQRAVALTQQTAHAKDAPAIWRQNGLAKLAMIFTSDMAQTFGLSAYDFARQIRTKKYRKAFATMVGYTMTALLVKGLTDGGGDEDDEDERGCSRWVAEALAEQAVASIPMVGKEAMMLYDQLSGNYRGTQYSAIMAPFERAARAARIYSRDDMDGDDFWRATGYALESLSLLGLAPTPATALKRLGRSTGLLGENEEWKAVKNLFGVR